MRSINLNKSLMMKKDCTLSVVLTGTFLWRKTESNWLDSCAKLSSTCLRKRSISFCNSEPCGTGPWKNGFSSKEKPNCLSQVACNGHAMHLLSSPLNQDV